MRPSQGLLKSSDVFLGVWKTRGAHGEEHIPRASQGKGDMRGAWLSPLAMPAAPHSARRRLSRAADVRDVGVATHTHAHTLTPMYTHADAQTRVHTHMYTHPPAHACTHSTHAHTHPHEHTLMCTHTRTHTCTHVCTCTHSHVLRHMKCMHKHAHTLTHAHTHTHVGTQQRFSKGWGTDRSKAFKRISVQLLADHTLSKHRLQGLHTVKNTNFRGFIPKGHYTNKNSEPREGGASERLCHQRPRRCAGVTG